MHETNMLIKNTLESSLKSFNDFVLFKMSMLMPQRLPPSIQPPPTIVVQSHPKVLAPIIVDPVLAPLPSLPKPPPSIP